MTSKIWKSALVAISFLLGNIAFLTAQTPAPYLLPYTINTIAGGGTAPAVGAACPGARGTTGNKGTATDVLGDGCLASSSSVTSVDTHDVGVDSEGNVYFIDNGSPVLVRRIDAHSGLITIFVGGGTASAVCGAIDKYGDNCPPSGGFTSLTTARGLGVVKNGDVYLAHYTARLINKISASTGIMTIVAGALTGTPGPKNSAGSGYTGDGGPATSAENNQPRGVTADAAGNVYFADSSNNVVRMVNTAGIISTVVGKYPGSNAAAPAGLGGDGGPATAAVLNTPEDVEIDASGNLFIADQGNSRVRVVYAGGAQVAALIAATNNAAQAVPGDIYTIMGGATTVYTPGSVVLATSVAVAAPRKIALDVHGNIFLADNSNDVIWFLDGSTGFMRTIAGTFGSISGGPGCPAQLNPLGDNCQATLATFSPNSAMGVGVDAQENLYVSDSGDQRIRKISVNQIFPAVTSGSSATQNLVVHFAAGDTPAATSPFAITGSADFTAAAPNCTLNSDQTTDCTIAVTFSPTQPGSDTATLVVKSTLGTSSQFGLNGVGAAASIALDPGLATALGSGLKAPAGVALDAAGNAYLADAGNNVVLRYDTTGTGTVIAGTGSAGNSGNGGPATSAALSAPSAVAVTPNGAVYIADTANNVVRRIDPITGVIDIAAGGAATTCAAALDPLGNGCLGPQAKLTAPAGLASDPQGNLYIADTGNNVIRELTASGYIFTIGGPSFSAPTALQADGNGNIFVADTGHSTISEIVAATGTAIAVAGNGQNGSAGNGGAATSAELSNPTGLALDAAGDLYIADTGNHVIRLVNAAGTINTVAGTLGQSGSGTLPGSVNGLLLNLPGGVAATASGKLYVLDSANNRAFTIDRTSAAVNLGTSSPNTSSPVQTIQQTDTGTVAALLPQPNFTGTGDTSLFTIAPQGSLGCTGGESLTPGATCFLAAQFNPIALAPSTATYTEAGIAPALPFVPTITLSGIGANLRPTTSVTVLTSPATGNPQFGTPFVVSTTVTPTVCNTSAPSCVPTGTVQFFVGTTPVGAPATLDATGVASSSIGGQNVGTFTVTAVYNGDSFYGSSTAPALSITVITGAATAAISFSSASLPQFQPLTISAKLSSASGSIPTGTVTFLADGKAIGAAALNAAGVAIIVDPVLIDPNTGKAFNPIPTPNTFGLFAGAHAITAAYSGDANYNKSTSPAATLTIQPDAATFSAAFISPTTLAPVNSLSAGTAQGSTALATVMVVPSNTLSGTVTFACSGLPANSVCTVTPTSLTFAPVPGAPVAQTVGVTLWTDVAPGTIPTSTTSKAIRPAGLPAHPDTALATLLGWPLLLTSFAGILAFRKRLQTTRLLALLVFGGLLAGGSMILGGCSSGKIGPPALTPVGSYKVALTVSGPNNTSATMPIQFTVAAGVAGQE
ncbi:MAG TPA: Ig-like domain repeat protein [Edaphobacter sp.]|nr:Ig-like domain repeat protein [Edaphobacter sp.]